LVAKFEAPMKLIQMNSSWFIAPTSTVFVKNSYSTTKTDIFLRFRTLLNVKTVFFF